MFDGKGPDEINQRGCFDLLKDDIKNNINILGGVAIGVGCVQVRWEATRGISLLLHNIWRV